MRKLFAYTTLMVAGVIVPSLRAADCSNSDLYGAYSFVASGTIGNQAFVTTGQTIYNGDGTAAGIIQAFLGGAPFTGSNNPAPNAPPVPWSATYSLTTVTLPGGQTVCVLNKTITVKEWNGLTVSFFGTAGDGFRELRFIATSPGMTVSGTAKKQ